MVRDVNAVSFIVNLASLFAQCSTLEGAECTSAFDSEVPAGARGSTSGAVAQMSQWRVATLGVEVAGEGVELLLWQPTPAECVIQRST